MDYRHGYSQYESYTKHREWFTWVEIQPCDRPPPVLKRYERFAALDPPFPPWARFPVEHPPSSLSPSAAHSLALVEFVEGLVDIVISELISAHLVNCVQDFAFLC